MRKRSGAITIKTYAGVGSRSTPPDILELMTDIAIALIDNEYCLNSGGADGADTAFEKGATIGEGDCNIFLPWPKFNGHSGERYARPKPEAYDIAATIHPAWEYMKPPIRALIARNMHQVLGWSLQDPVDFVVCWTADGAETKEQYTIRTGGTGTAIALASREGIPVFNLCNDGRVNDLFEYVTTR